MRSDPLHGVWLPARDQPLPGAIYACAFALIESHAWLVHRIEDSAARSCTALAELLGSQQGDSVVVAVSARN